MVLVVVALVVVDLVILGAYTVVEGARGNLGAKKIENKEDPTDTRGVNTQRFSACKIYIYVYSARLFNIDTDLMVA